jgi:cadmium resistance protein CadD (predicted permease)
MLMILLYGIYSFVITGVDDFLVLVLFHIKYPKKFKYVMYGTLLGLLTVMIPAYISAIAAEKFLKIDDYINPNFIIAFVLLYLAYNLLKEYYAKDEENEEILDIKQKSNQEVIILSATTYFFNGLDDYVIYTSFYIKGNSSIMFSIGIVLGLFIFGIISSYFGQKIVDMNFKRTKLILAIILISISALIFIF